MNALVVTAATAGVIMGAGWLMSLRLKDTSIVDPLWGFTFVAVAWAIPLTGSSLSVTGRGLLMLVMVTIWGTRLSLHLAARKRGEPEDYRYAAMRRRWTPFTWWSLPIVFGLQAALVVIVSLPIQAVMGATETPGLGALDWVGCTVWTLGMIFETVADEQLRRFKADPANASTVLQNGLWRYSRHPNYFGDFCIWWGLYLLAVAGEAAWTVAGPLVMSILLVRVSGVRLLEATIGGRRPGYDDYIRRTSAFLPLPPRR